MQFIDYSCNMYPTEYSYYTTCIHVTKVANTVRNQKLEGLRMRLIMVDLAAHFFFLISWGIMPPDPPAQSTQHIVAYDVW